MPNLNLGPKQRPGPAPLSQTTLPTPAEGASPQEAFFCTAMESMLQSQKALMETLSEMKSGKTAGGVLDNADPLRGVHDRQKFSDRLENESNVLVEEWYTTARWEAKVPEGYPFHAEILRDTDFANFE